MDWALAMPFVMELSRMAIDRWVCGHTVPNGRRHLPSGPLRPIAPLLVYTPVGLGRVDGTLPFMLTRNVARSMLEGRYQTRTDLACLALASVYQEIAPSGPDLIRE